MPTDAGTPEMRTDRNTRRRLRVGPLAVAGSDRCLSYSPRVSQGQVINAKGYRGLGHTDGIVIITPVFG
jgi:hypothetical protein